ncbi:GNAT family N-acetyltransferase [Agromyces laixinhei]|uniref:GNAT family N-acetyltransferase n=1 Tax=Agromyces laixinhei TaxID=2585717 RepID=UPI0012ECBCE0|nr:GNAT family N-acetyltransferase [Agromyces laixinhei]
MNVDIRPIPVPTSLGTPEAADFEAYVAFAEALAIEVHGTDELSFGVDELLVFYRDERYVRRRAFGAWDDNRLVGVANVSWELDPDATTAFSTVFGVTSELRRRGIGSRLLAELERTARDAGRPALVLRADHRIDDGDPGAERLRAPQGDASIPADEPAARFALAHGYALGQLDRMSAMAVTSRADEFRERLAHQESASPGYRLVTWHDRTPEELVDAMAHARERMSVDAPSAGIYEQEAWDADRIRSEEQDALDAGRGTIITAAIADDDAVAGYTQFALAPRKRVAYQDDTLVLADHRGHGLGMRMKLANLIELGLAAPDRERVITWNADENAHMLAINVTLGFEAVAMDSSWQKGRPEE